MIGLSAALSRIRELVEGQVAGAKYAIPSGTFLPTDDRRPITEQPEHATHRRYDLVWTRWDDDLPQGGRASVTGQLVDSRATALLTVGYLQGGGGDGAQTPVSDQMAEDAYLLRRVLADSANYDSANTGIMDCAMTTAVPQHAKPGDRRAYMQLTLELMLRDDWSTE